MYWIITRDENGRLGTYGESRGYYSRAAAEDVQSDYLGESFIGEGYNRQEARRDVKFQIANKYGAGEARHNVRSG